MRREFAFALDSQEWILQLNQLKQSSSESIRVFGYRTNRIVRHAINIIKSTLKNVYSYIYLAFGPLRKIFHSAFNCIYLFFPLIKSIIYIIFI